MKASGKATDPRIRDNWLGGCYELAINLGAPDDERLDLAAATLWDAAGLRKRFARRSSVSTGPSDLRLSSESINQGQLRSVARVPGLGSTLCLVDVSRDERPDGGDLLRLGLPLGALGNLDRRVGGYPFDDSASSRGWREPIEAWFEHIARAVFVAVPFAHAVTGFEVSGLGSTSVAPGTVGLYRPGRDGELVLEPVTRW